MTDREAMQQALDWIYENDIVHPSKVSQALRAALEQKAEPVACKTLCELCVKRGYDFCANVAKTTPIIILPILPKQQVKPVAWMDRDGDLYRMPVIEHWAPPNTLLYAAPPQRKPLTDADIKLVMDGRGEEGDDNYIKPAFDPYGISEDDLIGFARAIEQAHGIEGESHD
tara:strand:+ start:1422 stop:1931 length:510 start_codon:yes stop_codon:yes gene_type:complete